jgi:DNA-binding FadR family transcriptional regulator
VNITETQAATLREGASQVAASEDNLSLNRSAMQLRMAIADACGYRPVLLFMRSLARVLTHYVRPDLRTQYRDREFEHGVAADLTGIVEAIIAGNTALGAYYVKLDVERREHRARELAVAQPLLDGGPLRRETPNKLAEKVAYAIRDDIARAGWRIGERLGDEAELPEKYGVSLWVLRQAIRILEPSGIVKVRRGQGGGLYIGRPSPEHTIETAVSYLTAYQDSTGVSIDSYLYIRRSIFQEIAQFAAKRSTQAEREQLVAIATATSTETSAASRATQFWKQLSAMGRNQVLDLFGAILNAYIAAVGNGASYCGEDGMRLAIAEVIRNGDAPLAQRRMGNYLSYEKSSDSVPHHVTDPSLSLLDPVEEL